MKARLIVADVAAILVEMCAEVKWKPEYAEGPVQEMTKRLEKAIVLTSRALAEPVTKHGQAAEEEGEGMNKVKLHALCVKIESSIDAFVGGQPYILTYSEILSDLKDAMRPALDESVTA